jgi:CHAD domain-containing protein
VSVEEEVRLGSVRQSGRRSAAGPRPPAPAAPAVGPESTGASVVRAAIASSTARLLRHEAGVRLGEDPEAVHQARVATRRLRSDLRTYRDLLDRDWTSALREELRWLADALGEVRDAEVLTARLTRAGQELPAQDRLAAVRLLARLAQRREDARNDLLEAMSGHRFGLLAERLTGAAHRPALLEAASRPATELLPAIMRRPWKRLRREVEGIGSDRTDEALHAVRIKAKRARYAAESMLGVYGKPAGRFAAAAEELQDILGEHQDSVVAREWLRAEATDAPSAYVAGEMATMEHRAALDARAAWPRAWRTLSRKRLRFWT